MRRVAVVTGAASGIGAEVAASLAAAGHNVALIDRNGELVEERAVELRQMGYTAIAFRCDVSRSHEILRTIKEITKRQGQPDILINNAGFALDHHLLHMPVEAWDEVVDTHLRGSFLMLREVAPGMASRNWGRVVNISSMSTLGAYGRTNYVAAKTGLEGLTRSAALDLASSGITVNAVAPGVIPTGMTEVSARRAGRTVEEHLAVLKADIPVGRLGHPKDIARAVLFFVAEDAGFVTGQVLYVTGGQRG